MTSVTFTPLPPTKVRLGLFAILLLVALLPQSAFALTTTKSAFRLEDSSQGNVLLGDDSAAIEAGEVYGTVVLLWGNLGVYGQVSEVVVLSGKVTFYPGAKLTKSLAVMGGSFESQPGAQVPIESVVYGAPGPLWRIVQSVARIWTENISWMAKAFGAAISCVVLWLLALLLLTFFPALQGVTAGRLASQWPNNLFVGLVGMMLVPAFGALLVISIVGILLLPLYVIFLALAGLISYLGAVAWAGHRLLPPRAGEKLNPWGLLLGVIAFQLLWLIGSGFALLPIFGLWTLSWGALLRSLRSIWK